jgi:hypothetical protein
VAFAECVVPLPSHRRGHGKHRHGGLMSQGLKLTGPKRLEKANSLY